MNGKRPSTGSPAIVFVLGLSAALISAVLFLSYEKGIPVAVLTRDPNATAGLPLYTGLLSQIGLFFWAAAATICVFGATVLAPRSGARETTRFFWCLGGLTLVLGLDDAFLFHEELFPHYLGIAEELVVATYAAFLIVVLVRFRSLILGSEYGLLAMALVSFGVSVGFDALTADKSRFLLIEDSTKAMGIISWMTYCFRTAAATTRNGDPTS